MTRIFKAALCAAAVVCASPAAAAINFTIAPGAPVAFSTDTNSIVFNFFAQADIATTFEITFTGYDQSTCNAGIFCVPFDRQRIVTTTVAVGPSLTAVSRNLNFPPSLGPVINRNFVFSTTGSTAIRINNMTTQFGSLVPEPSTWALILAGFGLMGYALRRRRVAFVCSYSPAASGCSAR